MGGKRGLESGPAWEIRLAQSDNGARDELSFARVNLPDYEQAPARGWSCRFRVRTKTPQHTVVAGSVLTARWFRWRISACRMSPLVTLPVSIRPAVPADSTAVLTLFEAHLRALRVSLDPILDADMSNFPAAYTGTGRLFLVAMLDGHELAGMAGVMDGEIRRVHVRTPWRRHGIGQLLVTELLERASWPPGGQFRAVVGSGNEASRRLFQCCGFTLTRPSQGEAPIGACDLFVRSAGARIRQGSAMRAAC